MSEQSVRDQPISLPYPLPLPLPLIQDTPTTALFCIFASVPKRSQANQYANQYLLPRFRSVARQINISLSLSLSLKMLGKMFRFIVLRLENALVSQKN